jgi:hypothetical protein
MAYKFQYGVTTLSGATTYEQNLSGRQVSASHGVLGSSGSFDGALSVGGGSGGSGVTISAAGAITADAGIAGESYTVDTTEVISADRDIHKVANINATGSILASTTVQATTTVSGATVRGNSLHLAGAEMISAAKDLYGLANVNVTGTILASTTVTATTTMSGATIQGNTLKVGGSELISSAKDLYGLANVNVTGAIITSTTITAGTDFSGSSYVGDSLIFTGLALSASAFHEDGFVMINGAAPDPGKFYVGTQAALCTQLGGTGLASENSISLQLDLNGLGAATVDVAADSIAIIDADAGSDSKKESIVDLVDAIAGARLSAAGGVLSADAQASSVDVASKADQTTLDAGLNYTAALTGAIQVSLPGSPSTGDVVYLKAGTGASVSNRITVETSASHTIDGLNEVLIESPQGAITFIFAGSNAWKIV